jgi:uncharacterized protein YutE (UPF0331/DUF86 family)
MSRNAVVPAGRQVPLWDQLGRELAEELPDYPYVGALDAISAYSHEYGRPKMVERVAEALLIDQARPGQAHRAFCSILFDLVCTTNVDFLLERQYEAMQRYCRPIVDEDHLTVNDRSNTTALLKLHGDVHHPARLVLTEEDYDGFLDKYPLLATYLANLLITRTAVLIGYSLDDPDFRQVWHVVGERLGKARRLAYTILVDAKETEVARFARRGVRVIGLPGSRSKYSHVLASALDELREYMQTHLIGASHIKEEEPLTEFSLPQEALTRLCLFAVPLTMEPQYRDQVFPLAELAGLVPVTAADVIAPGENYTAKIDAIMRRSVAAVIDVSSQNTLLELGMILEMRPPLRILVVGEAHAVLPWDVANLRAVRRNNAPIADQPELLATLRTWLRDVAAELQPRLAEEPQRLLGVREYRAAVISAMTLLESVLREVIFEIPEKIATRARSLGQLVEMAEDRSLISAEEKQRIREWLRIRNMVVHGQTHISRAKAKEVVAGVLEVSVQLRSRRVQP